LDRVFLDANVVFSAAYSPGSRLLELWQFDGVELVTSLFALEEARRNLSHDCLDTLDETASKTVIVSGTRTGELPDGVQLVDKDIPILLAAIDARCKYLLTGDKRHFDALYGKTISGVLILTPAQYLHIKKAQASG
jgi:predicted nucleic acid-binding protein